MRAAPYVAFRWETPPLDSTNIEQPFECLLHDSPELDVPANPTDFNTYFQTGTEVRIGPLPVWLSTAGGGVDWLHMRLDERPKYYRHLPWRNWAHKK